MLSGFDRVAHIYRWGEYATFGTCLHRARTAHLADLAHTQHALVLGDGDGRFTQAALRAHPHLHVTAVDSSMEMLKLLQRRCGPYKDRLHTLHADITTADLRNLCHPEPSEGSAFRYPPGTVVTHFFLDCLTTTQLQTLLAQLRSPTRWILSDFHIPAGLLRLPSKLLVRTLYAAFRLLTGLRTQQLPDWRSAFAACGWQLEKRSSFLGSLLVAETWRRDATLRPYPASEPSGERNNGDAANR